MRKKEKTYQNLILWAFIIFSVYYSYRYVFKYNSEGTSPTYSDTPLAFQLAKYVIAILFILVFFLVLLHYNERFRLGFPEKILFCGITYSFIISIWQQHFDFFIKYYIFILPAYIIMFVKNEDFENRFIRLNKYILLYHIIYSVIQFGFFFFMDRLPALGYAGGLVRFGGAWDDPNAFALYLIIPMCYTAGAIFKGDIPKKKIKIYYFVLLICIILELLTFSFTGYLGSFIAVILMIIKYRKSNRLWTFVFFAFIAAFFTVTILSDKLLALFAAKSGSLFDHLSTMLLKINNENLFIGFLFGNNRYSFSENFYNILFMNYGIFFLLGSLGLKMYVMITSYHVSKHKGDNILMHTFFVFIVVFTVCQIGLPYSIIFPVNFIYWLCAFWMVKENRAMKISEKSKIKLRILVRNSY